MSIRFDIITIFPELFGPYINESILKRAQQKKLIDIRIHNLRDFTKSKHKKVDDKAYGGGPGMVIKIEPLTRVLGSILKGKTKNVKLKTKIILFTPAGKQFDSKMAKNFTSRYNHIIMIAGRYEGVDERIKKVIKNLKLKIENLSVGPYVLTGGELPALIIIDAVSRHIPGVLGAHESLEEKRGGVGIPAYTRPEKFIWNKKSYTVPNILLSGNHKKIAVWRKKHQKHP